MKGSACPLPPIQTVPVARGLAASPGSCGRIADRGDTPGREPMVRYVLDFEEIDQTQVAVVGGKGANLGELLRINGVRVPPGFCVTTAAFQRILAEAPSIDALLDRLSRVKAGDLETIRAL